MGDPVASAASGRELWLFTMRYPFGQGEAFLEKEMPMLCARFDRVRVFPDVSMPGIRSMPPNAELCLLATDAHVKAGARAALREPRALLHLFASLLKDMPGVRALGRQLPELMSRMGQFVFRMRALERELIPTYDPHRVVVLTYWWHDPATVLGLLRMRQPTLRFGSRVHGFDLFNEQNRDHWIPFRSFQLARTDKVFCVSDHGMRHLQALHPDHRSLFELFRLGTQDHGPGPFDPTGPLRLVSCAFAVPRKRVERIAEALALMSGEVEWVHFGDPYPPYNDVRLRQLVAALPPNIKADLRGSLPNHEVMQHYRRYPVDAFLLMSALEGGVPVAAQEAASFGIPVIASDSGGIRELVGPTTGVLLGSDPSPAELAELLEGLRQGPLATAIFRAGVRAYWSDHFRDTMNFARFHDRLLGLAHEGWQV